MEDESNTFAEPRTRESDVTVCVVAVGGIDRPVRVMLRVGVVLLEEIDSLFPSFPFIVGWPREILVGGIWRDVEEMVPLHQSSGECMGGDGLEIGRRGDELEDVFDTVLLDVGGVRLRRRVD